MAKVVRVEARLGGAVAAADLHPTGAMEEAQQLEDFHLQTVVSGVQRRVCMPQLVDLVGAAELLILAVVAVAILVVQEE